MNIVYLNTTPFGRFYYDPISCEGVAIPEENDPVVLGMKADYDPFSDPTAVELEVDKGAFNHLKLAATERNSSEVEEILAEHFSSD